MNDKFPIFGLLKKPYSLALFAVVFGILFWFNYYLMVHLVGSRDMMCVMGAGFTPFNMTFAFLMSSMAGLMAVGFFENLRNRTALSRVKVGSTSVLGLTMGTLTSFCTLCSLPALSLFGSSVSLGFFTEYEIYFKVISLVLLGIGFYVVNKEVKEGCKRCAT